MVNLDDYKEVKECTYKDEHYSARDNGAVLRHQREGQRKRKLDGVWSFGTLNIAIGYMDFCGERVHRIVATAFHGPAPSEQHVVDHIDTNRQNNRPENLRWLTKLENILNNEITRKKVELICGSIEAFLGNPSLLYGYETEDKNFSWMKNVTKEEAQNCLANWSYWAKTASPNPNFKREENRVGNWIFQSPANSTPTNITKNKKSELINNSPEDISDIEPSISQMIDANERFENTFEKYQNEEENVEDVDWYDSLTPTAKQSWHTPTEFPCCPTQVTENGLEVYKERLKDGELFSKGVYDESYSYYVLEREIHVKKDMLVVLSRNKGEEHYYGTYSLTCVMIEKGYFVHRSVKRFGTKEDATHFYRVLLGEEKLTREDEIWLDT